MKFERGRKKNQLIWSFILKDIASQSLVKVLFLTKPEKENVPRKVRFLCPKAYAYSKRFLFLFYFKKQSLTETLTGYIFLNKTPNEVILFPTSLKFNLVYFKIY